MLERDETKYVDLEPKDVKTREAELEKARPFSETKQDRADGGGLQTEPNSDLSVIRAQMHVEKKEDTKHKRCGEDVKDPSSTSCCLEQTLCPDERVKTHPLSKGEDSGKRLLHEEKHHGDDYLSAGSESDDCEEVDDEGLVLSYESGPFVTEDESHYITTHEIQLAELSDHEGDYDLGVGSSASWDLEDDSQVYSFVDYCFDGDGAVGERGDGRPPRCQGAAAAGVSTLPESDLSNAAKLSGSDEPQQGQSGGQIHLSIRTTSRAINEPGNIQEQENILYHARRAGDMSRCVFRGVDGKAETLCDRAKCFIAAPGRLHFGGKLRGKEVTEYSSGTSSAVSELDDADKEVRNLTARAFKSLAYPYFDAINFSTSSESSASERGIGINRWSTFVDLKYGNVNMSQGLDQSLVSCQNSAASFEIAKSRDNKGIKAPSSKIFTLNGNPHSTSSSTKKIQLMGKFGQGHGGVIRLTETLNFRCNVKSGMSAGERRTNFAQNAAGSRSTDEVTSSLLGGQGAGASKSPFKTMEDVHKKAVFASSLIKNVISKKMQFEQERRMERGEISEPQQAPSPCFVQQESDKSKGSRELQRQSSKFSESSSDYAIMCVDELGDIVDSCSCDTRSDSRRRDRSAAAPADLEQANAAGIDPKKDTLEASKSTLLRSQNSAFRCWKDEELGFQKLHKNDQTVWDKLPAAEDKESEGTENLEGCKLTRMSHLFVPRIHLPSSEQQRPSGDSPGDGGGFKVRSDNTLFITDSRRLTTPRSPEIKINLRRDSGTETLRAPRVGSNSVIRTEDFRCQNLATALKGESSDKVPHFMVRDIRDNKGKLQTPIHQVRDVRKLVKSSYHFVSVDNNENKSNCANAENYSEQKKHNRNLNSASPIVIKCQSVNTNVTGKQAENAEFTNQEQSEADDSSAEGASGAPSQGAAEKPPVAVSDSSAEEGLGLRIESKISSQRQEKVSEVTDKKPESKMGNQAALEKLQAAVKTMEQLYVFEKNEWKRKTEPQPLTDSHVLSLIASEELGGPEEKAASGFNLDKTVRRDSCPNTDKTPPQSPITDSLLRREDKGLLKGLQASSNCDDNFFSKSVQARSRNMSSSKPKISSASPNTITPAAFSSKAAVPKSPKMPTSLKMCRSGKSRNEEVESRNVESSEHHFSSDNESYLTIPVKSQLSSRKTVLSADKTSANTFASRPQPTTPQRYEGSDFRDLEDHKQELKRSSIVMETHSQEIPSATIYHSLPMGLPASQPQVYCFSPALTPAPTLDAFQATQRKMLLDPNTGNYYLVDTPVQPATKRLFDPETGQYIEVPMPQLPMTPVPMPLSPLALSPGAYGHTYMIYPGFMPAPSVIPARTLVPSQMSGPVEAEGGEKVSSHQTEGMYMESPFYMATDRSPQAASVSHQQAAINRLQHNFSSFKQPVISITSQQGPRIIAPPSFDGTTMSFVVEHR